MQVTFRQPVDPSPFAGLAGTTATLSDGPRLELGVTGPIGPLLRLIADHDPADLTSRHAGLDELFLGFYRDTPAPEASALAAASYLISSLAPVVSWLSPARYASLLYWSVGNSQITQGVSAADYAVLLATGLLAGGAAVLAFRRLDVR
jgi:hypothetical protein